MLIQPQARPAADYAEAVERARAFQSLDDDSIRPDARTRLLDHGRQTDLAVVLYHGFTNNPAQYSQFAPALHERGMNVFIPRLPDQGDKNRMTDRLKRLTAEELLGSASEALDIGCGLGQRVAIAGISTSGLLCAYFAQHRSDVAQSVIVAPVFGLLHFSHALTSVIGAAARVLPNAFLWWDPRVREHQLPETSYPRFPTRALAQTLRIADDTYAACASVAPLGASAVLAINRRDPAVHNPAAEAVVRRWNRRRTGFASIYTFDDLPSNHDIIDPRNPLARTDVVYPRLLQFIEQARVVLTPR